MLPLGWNATPVSSDIKIGHALGRQLEGIAFGLATRWGYMGKQQSRRCIMSLVAAVVAKAATEAISLLRP